MRRAFTHHVGHRGAFLALVGLVWIIYGVSIMTDPVHNQIGLTLLLEFCSLTGWATLWLIGGALALACVPFRQPGRDTTGFVGLIVPPVVWGAAYLVSWWPMGVYSRGWAASMIWLIVAAVVAIVASWPELPDGGRA